MNIINGAALAEKIKLRLSKQVRDGDLMVGLAIILVGDDPGSQTYVRLKKEAAEKIGIQFDLYKFPNDVSRETLEETIDWLNRDEEVHGIIIQLPLPKHLDENALISRIDPKKDADGFHAENIKAFLEHDPGARPPGLIEGIGLLIQETGIPLKSKKAFVLANSTIFANPLKEYLNRIGITTTIDSGKNHDLSLCNDADILVVAVGKKGYIDEKHIKNGCIVIDVGFNRLGDSVFGDVDASNLKDNEGFITPVPGGVGPMTVAMLLQRVVDLATKKL